MAHFQLKCCACNGNGDISPRHLRFFNHRKHGFAPRAQHRFTLVVRLGNADRHRVFLFRIRAVQKRSSATVHRTTRNGDALYFFALCSLCRFRDSIPLSSYAPIVFVNPAETGNHLARPRSYDEVVQAFLKLSRSFPCCIDIGNANAFVALRERLIIFPRG